MASNYTQPATASISFGFTKKCLSFFVFVFLLMLANQAKANPDYIPQHIDINKADTTVFIALPGIGSKLAARIIDYRTRLGGFRSINQVAETFGLQDSTFQKIKKYLVISDANVTKINLNTATAEQLKMPYISYNLANVILNYRAQHGPFKSIEDLKKIMLVDEVLFEKLAPYLTI